MPDSRLFSYIQAVWVGTMLCLSDADLDLKRRARVLKSAVASLPKHIYCDAENLADLLRRAQAYLRSAFLGLP